MLQVLNAQDHIQIFSDDKGLKSEYIDRFQDSMNESLHSLPFIGFKEFLPDGLYTYYDVNRKDSSIKTLESTILMTGRYTDSLRDGMFKYYSNCASSEYKSKKLVLTTIHSYTKGLLNGYYMDKLCSGDVIEGYFSDGKKNGFFLSYDEKGELIKIALYQEGVLFSQAEAPNITVARYTTDTITQREYLLLGRPIEGEK